MALLPAAVKRKILIAYTNSVYVRGNKTADMNGGHISPAIDAVDQFLEDNAVGINNTLPATYKATATSAEKALLLNLVAEARYGEV